MLQTRYVSQLPSPEDLERYRELIPDAPERLLAGGEREQAHRHEIEDRLAAIDEAAMPKFYEGQRRGHLISLALGLGYEALMGGAIIAGYPVAGIAGAATGLAAMIWAIRRDTDSPEPGASQGDGQGAEES
ncbi:DUF2335 domain-containing protein [Baekduia sp. Peel2402]|uniref:DUF2335 domain-containing protein n=1 Tax=Baekduia sp. Peel2402 TaxID=3458296 RepID=UPI00403EF1BB